MARRRTTQSQNAGRHNAADCHLTEQEAAVYSSLSPTEMHVPRGQALAQRCGQANCMLGSIRSEAMPAESSMVGLPLKPKATVNRRIFSGQRGL
jgi:hypothetical protein